METGKVISIVSGKGGTGKTMFAVNLGAVLALQGRKVAMVDMDNGLRSMDLYLGLENRVVYNVVDVMSGMCRIKQAMIRDKRFKCMYLIAAAPGRDVRDMTQLHVEVLCEKLKAEFDYVIIDAPAGIGDSMMLALAGADEAVVVTIPEAAAVRDADVVDRILIEAGIEKKFCIINEIDAKLVSMGAVPGIAEISRNLRMNIAGIIQYDDNIFIATNRGIPIVLKQGTYIEKNFRAITERIVSALDEDTGK